MAFPEIIKGYTQSDGQLAQRIVELGHSSVAAFQRWNGVPETSTIDEATRDILARRRCAVPDIIPEGAAGKSAKWLFKDVTSAHRVSLPTIGREQVNEAWRLSVRRWTEVCGISFTVTEDWGAANVYANSGRIDGAGGVLAWSYLPSDSGRDERIEQLFDDRENWNFEFLLEVATHELGHSIGIGHINRSGNIMHPYAVGNKQLGPQDIEEAVARYGPREEPVPPQPPPQPPGGGSAILNGSVDGKNYVFIGIQV